MIVSIFLLATAALVGAETTASSSDLTNLSLLDFEVATDEFAKCFEPKLADDPVIKTSIDKKVPFERLDNEVSVPAFQACLPILKSSAAGHSDEWQRWQGIRLMMQRNAFYHSRGVIALSTRERMRPYFACVTEHLAKASIPANSYKEKARTAEDACSQLRYSGGESEAVSKLIDRYQTSFAADAAYYLTKRHGSAPGAAN